MQDLKTLNRKYRRAFEVALRVRAICDIRKDWIVSDSDDELGPPRSSPVRRKRAKPYYYLGRKKKRKRTQILKGGAPPSGPDRSCSRWGGHVLCVHSVLHYRAVVSDVLEKFQLLRPVSRARIGLHRPLYDVFLTNVHQTSSNRWKRTLHDVCVSMGRIDQSHA